jgi:hypothetical protein
MYLYLLGSGHEIVIQVLLPIGQSTHHHMFVLLGQLLLDLGFESTQQKRPKHLRKTRKNFNNSLFYYMNREQLMPVSSLKS